MHEICNCNTTVCPPVCGDNPGTFVGDLSTNEAVHKTCTRYTTVCPPVRGDNPRALASELSTVTQSQVRLCMRFVIIIPRFVSL